LAGKTGFLVMGEGAGDVVSVVRRCQPRSR
jgi:hypothetical protein